MIIELLQSKIVVSCFIAFLVAQMVKSLFDLMDGKPLLKGFLDTGGMPSSHASLVTALTTAVYFMEGFSTIFIVTGIFSIIVLRDAFGVRKATGENTVLIKRIIKAMKLEEKLEPSHIKEILGHTPFQVIVGMILGFVIAVLNNFSETYTGLLIIFGTALYYAAPGLLANTAPIFAKRIPFLDVPVDMGKRFKGKRIFGSHKTYRGFLFAVISSIVLVYAQKLLYGVKFFWNLSYVNYGSLGAGEILLLGFLLGFGALFGDLLKSFLKRRLDVAPGKAFFPWDQLDYVIGILAFVWIFKAPTLEMTISLIVFAPLLHLLFSFVGYHLKLKEDKI